MTNELTLTIEPYRWLPCALRIFEINGMEADVGDFGVSDDDDPGEAPEYGCGCHRFRGDPSKAPGAMRKYGLTQEQFAEVCERLEDALYVGCCALCS